MTDATISTASAAPTVVVDVEATIKAEVAKACGADGFHCERPEEVRPAVQAALASPRAAVVEAVVDANEKPTKPDELRV